MNALVRIPRDPRDQALATAPGRVKGALVSIAHGLAELRHTDDLAELVNGVVDVLRYRLGCDERGWLLMVAAKAAEPDDLEALAAAVCAARGAAEPVPPLDDTLSELRAEAKRWAADASPSERLVYFCQLWPLLPGEDQAEFRELVGRAA